MKQQENLIMDKNRLSSFITPLRFILEKDRWIMVLFIILFIVDWSLGWPV